MIKPGVTVSRDSVIRLQPLSGLQVVARIILIISIADILIMLTVSMTGVASVTAGSAILDGLLLAAISIGPIYFWVVGPFARAHEEAEQQIGHLAYHDPLTDLPNRHMLFEQLEQALAACARHRNYGAVLLLDLDGFKRVNDLHGHEIGDQVLKQIANRLQHAKRQEDTAARLGGDEFIVLAQQLDTDRKGAESKARAIAAQLQQYLLQPVEHDGEQLQVGCSIGIRLMEPKRVSAAQIIREADIAMYEAKRERHSSVRLYTHIPPHIADAEDTADLPSTAG